MVDSIHTARWLNQFRDEPLDVEVFPSTPHRRLHPLVRELADGSHAMRLRISPGMRRLALVWGVADLLLGNRLRGWLLSRRVRQTDPMLIHALEIQHAGYLVLAARRALSGRRLVVTNWGSDIYWFGRRARHRHRIAQVLALATDYSAECHRDHRLAVEMGFRGRHLPVIPNAGGLRLPEVGSERPSRRKILLVKGYSTFMGRADEVLAVLPRLGPVLDGIEVVAYSADHRTRRAARGLARALGRPVRVVAKHRLTHAEVLELMETARVYVGYSMSDAISTAMLEAMAHGAFPIQTDTSCADEWIIPGETGLLVPYGDADVLLDALRRALTDDALVDDAAVRNTAVCRERLDADAVRTIATTFYAAST
jgi:glycosyltransferase involved in cell wall biosynthesis